MIERLQADGLGWQPISKTEAREILRRYRLTLRNVGYYGINLNGIHLRRKS